MFGNNLAFIFENVLRYSSNIESANVNVKNINGTSFLSILTNLKCFRSSCLFGNFVKAYTYFLL